jgi:uncharacterized protein (TIGR01244 family)
MRLPVGAAPAFVLVGCFLAVPASAQQVTKEQVPGITNFARLETTVACGGVTKPEAIPELKKMGFKSVINLRLPDEPGADIDLEAAAAKNAGLHFANIPFSYAKPDPKAVDRFLEVITSPGTEPAYIHCAGGGRAAMMWFIKRVVIDKWSTDRAMAEAEALGLTNVPLKTFASDYLRARSK